MQSIRLLSIKMAAKTSHFQQLSKTFRAFHSNPVNVALHLLSTPLGLLSLLCGIHAAHPAGPVLAPALTGLYAVSLIYTLPLRLWAVNTAALAALAYAATLLPLTLLQAALVGAAAYLSQDISHIITGEATYQSSYIKSPGGVQTLLMHTFYLLPLCLEAACHSNFLSVWFVAHNDVLACKLESPEEQEAMGARLPSPPHILRCPAWWSVEWR
jgi:hypothetical protein